MDVILKNFRSYGRKIQCSTGKILTGGQRIEAFFLPKTGIFYASENQREMYVEPWQEAINNEEIQDKYYARLTIKAGVK